MEKYTKTKECIWAILCVIVLTAFDQFTKLLALRQLKGNEPFVLWKGVFELHYLENRGAAFGILQNQRIFFVCITIIMVIVIGAGFWRTPKDKKFLPMKITLVFLLSGAIGNFIDRMIRGFVVDFFYFSLIDFPIFNVADIYVTVSFVVLAVLILFVYKEEDLAVYTPKKKK